MTSIIVVSYNHGRYVEECLDSIRRQSATDWELIVADDHSKDDSITIIERWLGEHNIPAKKVFNDKNIGFCATLNKCLEQCAGTFIKIIAADDFLEPGYLEKCIQRFSDAGDVCGLVYTHADYVDADSVKKGQYLINSSGSMPEGWVHERLLINNFIPAPAAIVRKAVYDSLGVYDTDILIEDYDFWLRLSIKYQIAAVNETLCNYRIHSTNITSSHDMDSDILQILIKNDTKGLIAERIKKTILHYYKIGKLTAPVINRYKAYPYRDKILAIAIKKSIWYYPYKILELVASGFSKKSR